MKPAASEGEVAPQRAVTDERGGIHTLEHCLGQGAQGSVWLVRGGRRVVKLLSKRGDREGLRRRIAAVRRLDLRDLHVAHPLALLRAPDVGYVAEFLDDMMPIGKLLSPPKGARAAAWYQETGGLRRRLRLLAHAGEALAGLGAHGLIYGDVSHHNIFVSAPVQATEAWLIDLDNLRADSDLENAVYTPGYGAPEVVAGKAGPTSLSDAFGFAVLAFNVLTVVHPFRGDLVEDGDPDLEEEAFAGRLPWVEHEGDPRNRSSRGIHPRTTVLGDRLLRLCRDTFEDGLHDRAKRPSVSKWVDRLHRGADLTISCRSCGSTHFASALRCPFCDAERGPVRQVRLHRWEPGRGIVDAMGTLDKLPLADEPVVLTRRHTRGETGPRARSPEVTLLPMDRGVRVKAHDAPVWVTRPGGTGGDDAVPVIGNGRVIEPADSPEKVFTIHFEPVDTPHRVATVWGGRR